MMVKQQLLSTAICLLLSSADASSSSARSLLPSANNEDATTNHHNHRHEEQKNLRRRTQQSIEIDSGSSSSSTTNTCKSIIAIGGTKRIEHYNLKDPSILDPTSRLLQEVYSGNDIEHPYRSSDYDYETDEEFVCELDNGDTIPLQGTNAQIAEMRMLLNQGAFISAESTVKIDSFVDTLLDTATDLVDRFGFGDSSSIAGISNNNDVESYSNADDDDSTRATVATLPMGSIQLDNSNVNNDSSTRRHLQSFTGTKKTLVIRVTDKSGRAPDGNAAYLSDKFFGTYGDPFTMANGWNDCTFGRLKFSPDSGNSSINAKMDAPGVIDVSINYDLPNINQSEMRTQVLAAARKKLGFTLPNVFHHVLIVVEKCYENGVDNCKFAAYAFVKHWLVVYVEDNYKFPAVSQHEIGHNMNLAREYSSEPLYVCLSH